MSLIDRLLGEVHAGLPRLRGAMVHGVLPVHHRVVDELLPLLPGWPAGARVAFGPDQQRAGPLRLVPRERTTAAPGGAPSLAGRHGRTGIAVGRVGACAACRSRRSCRCRGASSRSRSRTYRCSPTWRRCGRISRTPPARRHQTAWNSRSDSMSWTRTPPRRHSSPPSPTGRPPNAREWTIAVLDTAATGHRAARAGRRAGDRHDSGAGDAAQRPDRPGCRRCRGRRSRAGASPGAGPGPGDAGAAREARPRRCRARRALRSISRWV